MKTLRRFLKLHPGSSFPTEAETTDGERFVIKLRGSGNGARSLVNELVVNRIAARAGWPVPDVFPVAIPEGLPWEFGTDEFDDLVQRSYGVNLGIRLIEGATALGPAEALASPPAFLEAMAWLDALFCNHDRTTTSPNVLRDATGKTWLVDHGSCVFLNRSAAGAPLALPPAHMLKADEARWLSGPPPARPGAIVAEAVAALPQPWLDELGFTRDDVQHALDARLRLVG